MPATRKHSELRRTSLRSLRFKEAAVGIVCVLPWVIRLCALHIYPILASFYYSLTRYSIIGRPVWVGLANYIEMFAADKLPLQALSNSAFYSGMGVPLYQSLALLLALMLNEKVRGLSFFRSAIFVPSIVPAVASSVLWLWLLNPRVGLINFLLTSVGLPRVPWLTSAAWIKPAFVLMSLWGVGWTTVIYLAGLQDIPHHLYEAAEIDGAGAIGRFFHVTLPLLTPTILFNLVLGIISSLQVFGPAFIVLRGPGGGPQNAALFYVLYLFRQAFLYMNMGYASALAVVMFMIILVLTLLVFRSSTLWVYYESEVRK